MKIQNMRSSKTGRAVPNQFTVKTTHHYYFQSYDSVIVMINTSTGATYLDKKYWNYSRTTSRYRNLFLGETTKETQAKIDGGKYILTNLN